MLPLIWTTIFVLSIIFTGTLWTIRYEKRMWNNGICKQQVNRGNLLLWTLVEQLDIIQRETIFGLVG